MPFKSEKQRRYLFANEPEVAKKFAKDYNMGGVASMFRKRLSEGDDPFYEAWKKVYEQNPDAAAMNERHDEYLEKYKLEMSMQTSDAPMEETEETTEVVEETADPLLNLFQPSDTLASDQAMTTLFTPERPEGIMAAANGGKAIKKIKGQDHMLAYITPREAQTLENLGGQKTMTKEGIPAYPPGDNYGGSSSSDDEGETSSDSGFSNTSTSDDNAPDTGGHSRFEPGSGYYGEEVTDKGSRGDTKTNEPETYYDDEITRKSPIERIRNKRSDKKNKYNRDRNIHAIKQTKNVLTGNIVGTVYAEYKFNKDVKEPYVNDLKTDIEKLTELGVPTHSPHTDTLVQTLNQEVLDLTQPKSRDDKVDKDGPTINPITLEVDEDYAQGETLDFNMMSALDKIRQNQAVRSGLVERGIVQDNELMLANKGGLAGLFRVKNQ